MPVLVTGGAGYIGSHFTKALAATGAEIIVFDDFSTGHRWAAKWGRVIEGSLADTALLARVFRENQIESVVHFAAKIAVGESVKLPGLYYENNFVGALHLLEAMREANVDRLVFSSSAAVYGMPEKMPITEDAPHAPVSPYGETKHAVERMLHWFGNAHGIRSVALRYFNAAGADPEGELGEDHQPETHLIPLVLDAGLGLRPPVQLFGTDYPTPDGTAIRDYIHVSDLAAAHLKALDYLGAGGASDAFNLGTGEGHSVLEIIRVAERVLGRGVPVVEKPRREGDPPVLVADSSKAQTVLGWKPRYSDLGTILGTAFKWHTKRAAITPSHA